jgi:hypothetical protein
MLLPSLSVLKQLSDLLNFPEEKGEDSDQGPHDDPDRRENGNGENDDCQNRSPSDQRGAIQMHFHGKYLSCVLDARKARGQDRG